MRARTATTRIRAVKRRPAKDLAPTPPVRQTCMNTPDNPTQDTFNSMQHVITKSQLISQYLCLTVLKHWLHTCNTALKNSSLSSLRNSREHPTDVNTCLCAPEHKHMMWSSCWCLHAFHIVQDREHVLCNTTYPHGFRRSPVLDRRFGYHHYEDARAVPVSSPRYHRLLRQQEVSLSAAGIPS